MNRGYTDEHNSEDEFLHYMTLHINEGEIQLYELAQPEDGSSH